MSLIPAGPEYTNKHPFPQNTLLPITVSLSPVNQRADHNPLPCSGYNDDTTPI